MFLGGKSRGKGGEWGDSTSHPRFRSLRSGSKNSSNVTSETLDSSDNGSPSRSVIGMGDGDHGGPNKRQPHRAVAVLENDHASEGTLLANLRQENLRNERLVESLGNQLREARIERDAFRINGSRVMAVLTKEKEELKKRFKDTAKRAKQEKAARKKLEKEIEALRHEFKERERMYEEEFKSLEEQDGRKNIGVPISKYFDKTFEVSERILTSFNVSQQQGCDFGASDMAVTETSSAQQLLLREMEKNEQSSTDDRALRIARARNRDLMATNAQLMHNMEVMQQMEKKQQASAERNKKEHNGKRVATERDALEQERGVFEKEREEWKQEHETVGDSHKVKAKAAKGNDFLSLYADLESRNVELPADCKPAGRLDNVENERGGTHAVAAEEIQYTNDTLRKSGDEALGLVSIKEYEEKIASIKEESHTMKSSLEEVNDVLTSKCAELAATLTSMRRDTEKLGSSADGSMNETCPKCAVCTARLCGEIGDHETDQPLFAEEPRFEKDANRHVRQEVAHAPAVLDKVFHENKVLHSKIIATPLPPTERDNCLVGLAGDVDKFPKKGEARLSLDFGKSGQALALARYLTETGVGEEL